MITYRCKQASGGKDDNASPATMEKNFKKDEKGFACFSDFNVCISLAHLCLSFSHNI